jgi:hypothetical protein
MIAKRNPERTIKLHLGANFHFGLAYITIAWTFRTNSVTTISVHARMGFPEAAYAKVYQFD